MALRDNSLTILAPPSFSTWKFSIRTPTAETLERRSIELLDLLNIKEYTGKAVDYISSACISTLDGVVVGRTRDELVQAMTATGREYPNLHVSITQVTSIVEDDSGYGTVLVFHKMTNHPYDLLWKEAVKGFVWAKEGGKWLCVRHIGMRGTAFTGERMP